MLRNVCRKFYNTPWGQGGIVNFTTPLNYYNTPFTTPLTTPQKFTLPLQYPLQHPKRAPAQPRKNHKGRFVLRHEKTKQKNKYQCMRKTQTQRNTYEKYFSVESLLGMPTYLKMKHFATKKN